MIPLNAFSSTVVLLLPPPATMRINASSRPAARMSLNASSKTVVAMLVNAFSSTVVVISLSQSSRTPYSWQDTAFLGPSQLSYSVLVNTGREKRCLFCNYYRSPCRRCPSWVLGPVFPHYARTGRPHPVLWSWRMSSGTASREVWGSNCREVDDIDDVSFGHDVVVVRKSNEDSSIKETSRLWISVEMIVPRIQH